MRLYKHANGNYYVRGIAPNGESFYKTTKSKDPERARKIGESWISGRKNLGEYPDESLPLSELLSHSSPSVQSFSHSPLPLSSPTVTESVERSNVLEFPTLPTSDQETRDALNAAMGIAPTPVTPIRQPDSKVPVKKDYTSLCEFLGSGMAVMFVGGMAWGMRQLSREPGKPADKQLKELGDAIGDQLKEWITDRDIKPWHRILLVSAMIAVGMWLQGKPIPKPEKKPTTPLASIPNTTPVG